MTYRSNREYRNDDRREGYVPRAQYRPNAMYASGERKKRGQRSSISGSGRTDHGSDISDTIFLTSDTSSFDSCELPDCDLPDFGDCDVGDCDVGDISCD